MRITKRFLLFYFLLIAACFQLQAQEPLPSREFEQNRLEELREEYVYEVAEPQPEGAFQRFLDRLTSWFWNIVGSRTTGNILVWLFRLLLLAAFVFFILKLTGTEISTVFKPAKPLAKLQIDEEQLSEIDFDDAIAKARQSQNWQLTVRLIYLKSLKYLWENQIIAVKKGKTNREYLYELGERSLADDFERLSYLFDYTYYGHFEATEDHVNRAEHYATNIQRGGRER